MFFVITVYDRSSNTSSFGRVVDSQAVTANQLGGALLRMMKGGAGNYMSTVEEISEDVFTMFYQERKNNGRKKQEIVR